METNSNDNGEKVLPFVVPNMEGINDRLDGMLFFGRLIDRLQSTTRYAAEYFANRAWNPEVGLKDVQPVLDEVRRMSVDMLADINALEERWLSQAGQCSELGVEDDGDEDA